MGVNLQALNDTNENATHLLNAKNGKRDGKKWRKYINNERKQRRFGWGFVMLI